MSSWVPALRSMCSGHGAYSMMSSMLNEEGLLLPNRGDRARMDSSLGRFCKPHAYVSPRLAVERHQPAHR